MYDHILIPTDGSELGDKAVHHGIALAKVLGAHVTILRATPPPAPIVVEGVVIGLPPEEEQRQMLARVEEHLAKLQAEASSAGVACQWKRVEHDQPWRAIIDAVIELDATLIVMASHGRRGVSALLLGSETQKVLTHSTTPVLVYR